MNSPPTERFFALLIGINGYAERPLSGCVNDIDRVQDFLIGKLAIPAGSIYRLEAPIEQAASPISPLSGSRIELLPRDTPPLPTYDNLVTALRALASDRVQPGDRILFYYSGHGSTVEVPLAQSWFEGIVPLDWKEKGLLLDVELNQMLQAIIDKGADLTVILDCCHSAGLTRHAAAAQAGARARFLPIERSMTERAAVTARFQQAGALTRSRPVPRGYTVVAACHTDERATECEILPSSRTHGLLTHSLFEILDGMEEDVLSQLRWSDIWEQLGAAVQSLQPSQRPMLLGPRERRVFGGPWQPQDAGLAIRRDRGGSYTVAAGSIAGLGVGARIAVYGPEPARFPPLDSAGDRCARLGELVVDAVQPAQAVASAHPRGAPAFAIPAGARGRLIEPGEPERLRVAVCRNLDPAVRKLLEQGASRSRFLLLPEDDPAAEAHVGQYADGDIWIGDTLFGPGPPIDDSAPGPMGRIRRVSVGESLDAEDIANGLRAGLAHYAQYVIALRMSRSGRFTLPAESVKVQVLDCRSAGSAHTLERDASLRREARYDAQRRCYLVAPDSPIAFFVYNTLDVNLYVFLLLCTMEGQLELIESDVLVGARSGKIFWQSSVIGRPFELVCPPDQTFGIERLIVLASERKGLDLSALQQTRTLNDAVREAMGTKNLRMIIRNPPILGWTASQILIQVGRPR